MVCDPYYRHSSCNNAVIVGICVNHDYVSPLLSAVFWGGREGFLSALNTDVAAELKHMANFFKMAVGMK